MCPRNRKEMSKPVLAWSSKDRDVVCNSIIITVAPEAHSPFTPGMLVEEQDRFLLLGNLHEISLPDKPNWVLANDVFQQQPKKPGSILVKGVRPVKIKAIIYDIEAEPICKAEWVDSAIANILQQAEQRRQATLAMPLLGIQHGHVRVKDFLDILCKHVQQHAFQYLKRIWLIVPLDDITTTLDNLRVSVNTQ